jgi:hypothetical protein
MNNDSLNEIEIDLNAAQNGKLNEGYLTALGGQIELLMKMMFGGMPTLPVSIRGTRSQLGSFTKVLAKEKRYMDAFNRYGLGNSATFSSKYKLQSAVADFERATGLQWPLK